MDDDRLVKALEHANYRATLTQQRENLKLEYAGSLLYSHNGGTFTVTPQLLALVDLFIRQNQTDLVLIDDKGTPIQVNDLKDFLENIMEVYAEASNDYHVAWERLRKSRTVEAIIKV